MLMPDISKMSVIYTRPILIIFSFYSGKCKEILREKQEIETNCFKKM